MKKIFIGAALCVAGALLIGGCMSSREKEPLPVDTSADYIYEGGNVWTGGAASSNNDGQFRALSLAIKDGVFLKVGTQKEVEVFAGENTKRIDLGGKFVMPGFIDAHCHPSYHSEIMFGAQLYTLGSVAEYLDATQEFFDKQSDIQYLSGWGWKEAYFAPNSPSRYDLDKISKDIPICLSSDGGHSLWLNSKALEISGITKDYITPETSVIPRDENGEPLGVITDGPVLDMVLNAMPKFTVEQCKAALLAYQNEIALPLGITSVFDAGLFTNSFRERNELAAYRELAKEGKLKMRVQTAFNTDPMLGLRQLAQFVKIRDEIISETAGDKNNLLDINGIKIYIDGVVEGKSAVLLSPYEKMASDVENYNSQPVWAIEQLNKFCAEAEKQGFRLHFHAIGDGAVRIALDAIEYAQKSNGLPDRRHGITHVQLVSEDDIKRFAELGVAAAINPHWMFKDDYFYDIELPYLGAARAEKQYPNNSFVKNGVLVSAGSDYPVTIPPSPLEGIQIGVTRTVPKSAGMNLSYGSIKDTNDAKYYQPLWADERVSVLQMLTAYTYNGAYSYAMEDITGSIETGKSADFIVLDENIFSVKQEHIRDIKIIRRVFRGE